MLQFRRPTTVSALILAVVLLAPLAFAHGWYRQEQYAYEWSNLVVQDCNDDWGVEGNSAFDGHDLGAIYVRDTSEGVFIMLGLTGGYAAGVSGTRSVQITLSSPQVTTTLTLSTSDNAAFSVSATNSVGATITRQPFQWVKPSDSPDGDPGTDGPRRGIELLVPHADLKVQNGEKITGMSATSYVGATKADYLPGGFYTPAGTRTGDDCPSQSPTTPSYDAKYVSSGYTIQQSTWTPPPPPPPQPANTPPSADFTFAPANPRANDTVAFTDASTDAEGPISAWTWTFGDGTTSAATNPTKAYTNPGTYQVELRVTDAGGLVATKTSELTVSPAPRPPTANFTHAPATPRAASNVTFSDASLAGTSAIVGWNWTFGDNTTSTQRNATHAYALPGTYSVRLRVTSAEGLESTLDRAVTILAPLQLRADFRINTSVLRAGLAINFTDNSTPGDPPISSYKWEFGDGETATTRNATHTYSTAGNHTVRLEITDAAGTQNATTRTLVVLPEEYAPLPVARFSFAPATPVAGSPVQFTDESQAPTTDILAWDWSFGDGDTASTKDAVHTYAQAGTYEVTLRVATSNGKSADTRHTVLVSPPNAAPVASFTLLTNATVGETILFEQQSTDADGAIAAYSWDLGDGATSTDPTPRHTYTRPGTYAVTLTVTDDQGASSTRTRALIIRPLPAATTPQLDTEIPHQATAGQPVSFSASASAGDLARWSWSFGDGETAQTRNATHTYTTPGTYEVTLRATTTSGEVITKRQDIAILPSQDEEVALTDAATSGSRPETSNQEARPARNEAPMGGAIAAVASLALAARAFRRR